MRPNITRRVGAQAASRCSQYRANIAVREPKFTAREYTALPIRPTERRMDGNLETRSNVCDWKSPTKVSGLRTRGGFGMNL